MNRLKNFLIEAFDLVSFLVLVGGLVLFIRFFLFNPYTVQGSSMLTTIHDGDVIIVDKITSRFRDYERGDVVVFVPPSQDVAFIKRVIGLPGETVKIDDGKVYICLSEDQEVASCDQLDELYLREGLTTGLPCGTKGKTSLTVPEDADGYVVFGDNRPGSTDSRCCFLGQGCTEDTPYLAPIQNILGKAAIRILPLSDIETF